LREKKRAVTAAVMEDAKGRRPRRGHFYKIRMEKEKLFKMLRTLRRKDEIIPRARKVRRHMEFEGEGGRRTNQWG